MNTTHNFKKINILQGSLKGIYYNVYITDHDTITEILNELSPPLHPSIYKDSCALIRQKFNSKTIDIITKYIKENDVKPIGPPIHIRIPKDGYEVHKRRIPDLTYDDYIHLCIQHNSYFLDEEKPVGEEDENNLWCTFYDITKTDFSRNIFSKQVYH